MHNWFFVFFCNQIYHSSAFQYHRLVARLQTFKHSLSVFVFCRTHFFLTMPTTIVSFFTIVTFIFWWTKIFTSTAVRGILIETIYSIRTIFLSLTDLSSDSSRRLLRLKLRCRAIVVHKASKMKLPHCNQRNSSIIKTCKVENLKNHFTFSLKTVTGCGNCIYYELGKLVTEKHFTEF